MEICLGELSDICFFYSGRYRDTALDVLQPKCPNCLGKCLFLAISGLGRVVFAWCSPLHGTGNDCTAGASLDAGCN